MRMAASKNNNATDSRDCQVTWILLLLLLAVVCVVVVVVVVGERDTPEMIRNYIKYECNIGTFVYIYLKWTDRRRTTTKAQIREVDGSRWTVGWTDGTRFTLGI